MHRPPILTLGRTYPNICVKLERAENYIAIKVALSILSACFEKLQYCRSLRLGTHPTIITSRDDVDNI